LRLAGRRRAPALLQPVGHLRARRLPCGNESGGRSGHQGHCGGKHKDPAVERDFGAGVDIAGVQQRRCTRSQFAGQTVGQEQPHRRAQHREQDAFGEQLAEEPRAAGAHGRADGQLAAALRAACQQEVGDVDAGNLEQAADRAEQDLERCAATARGHFGHWHDGRATADQGAWIVDPDPVHDGIDLGPGLLRADAGTRTRDHIELMGAAAVDDFRTEILLDGDPNVDAAVRIGEAARHHSGDVVGLAIQRIWRWKMSVAPPNLRCHRP